MATIATRVIPPRAMLWTVGVGVLAFATLSACTVHDDSEERTEAAIAAATEVRDVVDVQTGAGRLAPVELDSSEAFCDCPIATVRGTADGAALQVIAVAKGAAQEAGFDRFEPLEIPDGLDPDESFGFTASAPGLDLSFRLDQADTREDSEVILTVREAKDAE